MEIIRLTLLLIAAKLGIAQFVNSTSTITPSSLATLPPPIVTSNPKLSGSCDTCTIHGGEVQVYWWPTASDGQQIKTINVDAAGFTFLSPSIYVAFSTLYTANACSTGAPLPVTTIGFPQDALSTATGWRWNEAKYVTRPPRLNSAFILATWGNKVLETCTYITSSFLQPLVGPFQNNTYPDIPALTASFGAGFTFDAASWAEYTVSYNPCSPTLSAPQQIFTLIPGWDNCERGMDGFFDPPYALSVGGGLGVITTPAAPIVPSPTGGAVEGSTPAPLIPAPTAPPASQPTSAPVKQLPPNPVPDEPVNNPSHVPIANDPAPQPIKTTIMEPSPSPVTPQDPATRPINAPPIVEPSPNPVMPEDPGTKPPAQPANSPPSPIINPSTTKHFVVIGSQTVSAGSPSITVSGTPISLQPDGSSIIIGTSTHLVSSLLNPPTTPPPPIGFILGTQTIIAGGPAITKTDASGHSTVISVPPGALNVVVGSSTVPIAQFEDLKPISSGVSFIFGTQAITPGGPAITVTDAAGHSTAISLQAGASSAVVGQSTISIDQLVGLQTITVGTSPAADLAGFIISVGGFTTPENPLVVQNTGTVNSTEYNGTNYAAFEGVARSAYGTCTWLKLPSLAVAVLMIVLM